MHVFFLLARRCGVSGCTRDFVRQLFPKHSAGTKADLLRLMFLVLEFRNTTGTQSWGRDKQKSERPLVGETKTGVRPEDCQTSSPGRTIRLLLQGKNSVRTPSKGLHYYVKRMSDDESIGGDDIDDPIILEPETDPQVTSRSECIGVNALLCR